jgi:predicted TIM-barrel fold metal-dependent hydrolase
LDACPNLRIETSAYFLHRSIEYVVRHWGSGRLVYGSNWPSWGQGMSLASLTCAEIGDRDKLNIAGDNLRRLLAWCKTPRPRVSLPDPADDLERFGRSGRPPKDLRVVDCHGHLGGQARDYHLPDSTLEATLHEMDRLCVRKVCVFSFAGVWSDEVHGNNIVIDAVKRYPDRFVGFTMVNPHRGEKAMLQELGRCQKLGLRGVKLIGSYQGYPGDGPLIDVACKWAHEHRQIVLNHEWASPQQIERLAAKYPNACFLFGHAYNAFAEPVTKRKNVYVCSCPLWHVDDTEKWVHAIGPDRLLFGSDLQDLPVAWGLGPILFARIPSEQKRMILGGNLDRILQRYSRP